MAKKPQNRGPATRSAKQVKKVFKKTVAHKLTNAGQHMVAGMNCIATAIDGRPCPGLRAEKGIPLCKKCIASGDPSLKAVEHPKFGKILIAMRALPKGYRAAWWGNLTTKKKMTEKAMEWALEVPGRQFVDATPYKGSQLQFSACPGPSELPTVDFAAGDTFLQLIKVAKKAKAKRAGIIFQTLRDIPRHHQVAMMYNEDEKTTEAFFKDRGLTRADVGTHKYPLARKKGAGQAPRALR